MLALYLPGSPSALQWPHEWLLLGGWYGSGLAVLVFRQYPAAGSKRE